MDVWDLLQCSKAVAKCGLHQNCQSGLLLSVAVLDQ